MRRCRSTTSSPLAALALLLLLACFLHRAATARPLPAAPPSAGEPVLQDGAAAANGDDDLSVVSEVTGAEEVCEEGNEECMQRRLLRDAHLDYIYTQHKGGKQP